MKIRTISGALLAAAFLGAATAALAGTGDSPVPSISSTAATRLLFIVPGIIKDNGLETDIICTSLDTVANKVALEIFDPAGGPPVNDVSTASLNGTATLPAGGSVTIATGASVGFHEDVLITGLVNVKNGSGRILSTSTRVICTGMVVEKAGTTPSTLASLPMIARRTQNGD